MSVPFDRNRMIGLAALAGALGCWAFAAANAEVAGMTKEEADSLIYERQQVMSDMDKQGELIGSIVAGEVPPDKLAEVTKALAKSARESVDLWQRKVPGGDEKPEVWTQHDDFMKRMERFAVKSDEMAKVAQTGNMNGVIELLVEAMPCKECHDIYRIPKKKPAA